MYVCLISRTGNVSQAVKPLSCTAHAYWSKFSSHNSFTFILVSETEISYFFKSFPPFFSPWTCDKFRTSSRRSRAGWRSSTRRGRATHSSSSSSGPTSTPTCQTRATPSTASPPRKFLRKERTTLYNRRRFFAFLVLSQKSPRKRKNWLKINW